MANMRDTGKQLNKSISNLRPDSVREFELSFTSPNATKVHIAGSFNNWNTQSTPMIKGKDGIWKIKLKLPLGRCEYKFFVDGSWIQDTANAESTNNPFGTNNSVINVR